MVQNWGLKQPDGGATEKCVVMNISDEYRWHDRSCSEKNDYVCEKGKDAITSMIIGLYLAYAWQIIVIRDVRFFITIPFVLSGFA